MKTKLFAALLALLSLIFISCSMENSKPPTQSLIAIELIDEQGNNISKIAGDNASAEVFDLNNKKRNHSIGSCIPQGDSVSYFTLLASGGIGEELPLLTWKIKCKEVFGDDEIRTIESNWTKEVGWWQRCTSFTFEGKTYVPELKNEYWTARVVINR